MSNTSELLCVLNQMVKDVNEVNGSNEKIERIQKYQNLKPFLKLLYDPLQTTGVTSAQLEKFLQKKTPAPKKAKKEEGKNETPDDLIVLLNKLYNRDYSGNEAKEKVSKLICAHPEHKDLLFKIINKDLEMRMDIKQLNKAFPNLITEFSVALAKDFESGETYFKKTLKHPWFISRKYDGIRCIVKVIQGIPQAFSRNGNRLPALSPLEELLKSKCSPSDSFVLDGEVCSIDASGNENFTEAVSQAKRKSVQMEAFRYYVFDCLTIDEFDSGESKRTLGTRIQDVNIWMERINHPDKFRAVSHILYTPEKFIDMKTQAAEHQWEGLMLRLDTGYKGKRSNDILKVKNFITEEYVVQDYEIGTMRIIDKDTGLEKTIETLKSVRIIHKGNDVSVGSGFDIDERNMYYNNPNLIVGKTISVRYFEESKSKDGKLSLRFPTFVALHGEKREL